MRGSSRSRLLADGGTHHAALFESFPDPLLAYASAGESDEGEVGGDGDADTDPSPASFVVREVNAAFEATFDLGADEVTGTTLDGVVLPGTVTPEHDADDAIAGTDAESGAGGEAEAGTDDETTDPPATVTADSILDRVHDNGTAVGFRHRTDGETQYFHIRVVTAGTAGEQGYLLFTDVTDPERQRRDLAKRVALLERLASVARHDLRNPLDVAAIRLEAARDTGEDVHFEKVAGALDRIEHIVDDVLAPGAGGTELIDKVALDDVAEAAWETVDTADATLDVSTGLPTVRGDRDRLRQLFENLFRNAVEHGSTSPPSQVQGDAVEHGPTRANSEARRDGVEYGGQDVTVRVKPLPDGFAVADDGPGIPEEVRERAFEAGFSTAPGNSGLGLSVVREIAREHGWRATISSSPMPSSGPDGGAQVTFTGIERVENGDDSSERGGPGS